MIVALLNQKGSVGMTTLALHLAGQWARKGKRGHANRHRPVRLGARLVQATDTSTLRLPVRCHRMGRDTLQREVSDLARHADHVIIDGPRRVAALLRSALLVRDRNGGFATRARNAKSWTATPDRSSSGGSAADRPMARLTVDITPALRGRIKIAAFHRGITITDMLRDLLAREFLDTDGDRS
jgi:hypothetical protein